MIADSRFGFSGKQLHTEYAHEPSNWRTDYAFYLQGFSYAHIEAYQRHIQKEQQHEHR